MVYTQTLLVAFLGTLTVEAYLTPDQIPFPAVNEEGGQLWAVLVAGSTGYVNYRHQADVCHAFQVI